VIALYIIENGHIDAFAQDSRFLALLPCVARFAQIRDGQIQPAAACSRCGGSRKALAPQVYNEVKQCLAGLDDGRKLKLKELLNAAHISITYRTNTQQSVSLTF
jgi:hypothetical protein